MMKSPLQQALELTHRMLCASHAKEWDQVTVLELEREPLLLQQHPTDSASQALLGEILACDRELLPLISSARNLAAEQWQRENVRLQAVNAYATHP